MENDQNDYSKNFQNIKSAEELKIKLINLKKL